MVGGKVHISEDVGSGLVQALSRNLVSFGSELVSDPAPLCLGGLGAVLRECGGDESGDDASAALAGVSQRVAVRMVRTRQRCQVAFISLATAALMPS